jgi:hypothetical protein
MTGSHTSTAATLLLILALNPSAPAAPKPKSGLYGVFSAGGDGITIFPLHGKPITIHATLPKNASNLTAGPDGGSIYWIEAVFRLYNAPPHQSRLVRLDLHSLASVDIPGVEGIDVTRMEIRNGNILLSGESLSQPGTCGVWRVAIAAGRRERVSEQPCKGGPRWIVSSDSKLRPGPNEDTDWLDPDRLTMRKLPKQFGVASLSPDGTLIAATDRDNENRLFLLDPKDFSVRREVKWHDGETPRWSPDGRYLLRGKMTLHCTLANFSLDLDPPHTPVIVDVTTGKTKTLGNAHCRYEELQGWIADSGVTR